MKRDKNWCGWPCSNDFHSASHSAKSGSQMISKQPTPKGHDAKEPRSLGALLTRKFFRCASPGISTLPGLNMCSPEVFLLWYWVRKGTCDHVPIVILLLVFLCILAGSLKLFTIRSGINQMITLGCQAKR